MNDGIIRTCPEDGPLAVNQMLQPASWLSTMAVIKQISLNNQMMVAVLGEKGSGKTTFSNLLSKVLAPEVAAYRIVVDSMFNRALFLDQLKALLRMDGEASLSNFIAICSEDKSHRMLIIDEAHFLSAVFVEEMLGELQEQGHEGYFHVCLVSDFSLVSTLNRLEQNTYQGMVQSIELGVLSEAETKIYLLQNLLPRQSVEKIVTDAKLKKFYQLTAGHLADINQRMPYFFSSKASASAGTEKLFRQMSIAAGVLCVGLGANYVWHAQDFQSVLMAFLNQTPSSVSISTEVALPQIEPVFKSEIPSYEVAAIRQAILPIPLHRADLAPIDEEDGALDSSLVVVDKVIVVPKIIKQASNVPASIQGKSIHPIVLQSRFTIQLIASHNKDELIRFIGVHHLVGKTQVRSTQRQGIQWYVLTLGEFTQRQAANNAIHQLPKEITQFKPWVRAIADLNDAG